MRSVVGEGEGDYEARGGGVGRITLSVWQPEVVITSGFFSVVRRTSWSYGGLCENIANFV